MAGGQQINSGQGTITFEGAGATDALTGSAATTDSGSTAQGTSIRLRSRKVGGGAAAFLLTGQFASVQQETPVKQVSALLATPAVSGAQGVFAKSRSSALTGILIQVLQTSIGPQSGTWDINTVTFTQGTSGSSQLPVPSGYTAGGFFQLVTGSLPSGVTLSDSGLLSYNGSGAAASSSVTFSYTEPGALPTLTLHSTGAGTFPYMATIYPTEGAVPSGQILLSPDDSTFRSTVLSTWPDGSAQVMVGAGRKAVSASSTTTVRMRPGSSSGTNLTTTNIASVFTSGITVNFGTSLNLNTWSSPDRIWWQNPEVICARYRLPITNKGNMEAVIDVHAFADGSAFVEVVIENGKVNASAATVTGTSTQTYTNATVSVNGTTIATVSSPTASMATPNSRKTGQYSAGHEPFRAWYCSAKVVGGTVTALTTGQQQAEVFGIEVTHDATSLQAHPWFWKNGTANTFTLSTKYQQTYDTYVPWAFCRMRMPGMDSSGGDETLALFTREQSAYFLFADKYVRRAALATGQAFLSCGFNYRHTDGSIPAPSQLFGKNTSNGNWPLNSNAPRYGGENTADGSHIPATTLIPFLCRPSPCFIEIAQKEAAWNHTNYNSTDGSHPYDQERARGWRLRNYAIAAYLTPDSGTWNTGAQADSTRKAAYRSIVTLESLIVKSMLDRPWNTIEALWGPTLVPPFTDPDSRVSGDNSSTRPNYQASMFMRGFVAIAYNAVAAAKVLTGTAASDFATLANRASNFHISWINEAAGNEFRAFTYQPTIGVVVDGATLSQSGNAIDMTKAEMSGTVPTSAGPWLYLGPSDFNWNTLGADSFSESDGSYAAQFMQVIISAKERGVSGADSAWTRIYGTSGNGGISNYLTWQLNMNLCPEINRFPRDV